jgi:hypothetical protein
MLNKKVCLKCQLGLRKDATYDIMGVFNQEWENGMIFCHVAGGFGKYIPIEGKVDDFCPYLLEQLLATETTV